MSEYQYYEFVAVDRPLSEAQQRELRARTTRARITPSSFVDDYQRGDLSGDPQAWMEQYFDAFLHLANWGTHRIALRLPTGVLDLDTAARHCPGGSARCWSTGSHVILDLCSEDDAGDDWCDGEGRLAAIVPARAELAVGDHRLLYLAWLLCVQNRELDDDEPEPPVPAGLDNLSGPLRATADFLRLDPDLLAAAAEASPPRDARPPSQAALTRWVRALPAGDKDDLLVRLLRGDDATVRAQLLRRYHGSSGGHPANGARPAGGRVGGAAGGRADGAVGGRVDGGRTVGALLAAAEDRWTERQRQASQRATAERQRREQAAAAARRERLDALARSGEAAWQQVDTLIGSRKPRDYDAAVLLLDGLRALAERDADAAAFAARMRQLRLRHARKPSLLDRFDRARLA